MNAGKPLRVLFVTWDGPQVNYLESLFLPIFAGLRDFGVEVDVLQFRWGDQGRLERVRTLCAERQIGYQAVETMRRFGPIGPFTTALKGAADIRRAVARFQSDVIMPRSIMPALSTLRAGGAGLRPIIFDADGLPLDERVEAGSLNPLSATYRMQRDVELRALQSARVVIARSRAAVDVLRARTGAYTADKSFHVVTNGRDETLFRPQLAADGAALRESLGVSTRDPLVVYAGSVGPQYRFDLIAEFMKALQVRRAGARLLVLTGSPREAESALHDIGGPKPVIRQVAPDQVPSFLAAADLGLAFRSDSFAMRAVAPVKLGEYLLCGLPVVGTAGIGDTAPAEERGVFFAAGSDLTDAAAWLLDEVMPNRQRYRESARDAGVAGFSLQRSVECYVAALQPFL